MAWLITEPSKAGFQAITDTSTTQNHNIGTVVEANDPTYGNGAFIYLKGVASTAAGDVVTYDLKGNSTFRATTSSPVYGPVGVAMSANVASQYGWYQIRGAAVVNAATVAANACAQITGTAGTIDDTTTATRYIDGMLIQVADGTPSAGKCVCLLHYPQCNLR